MSLPLPHITPNLAYICAHRDWFIVNREYQRDERIWSSEDRKHLIDTILKNLDIPKIYLRKVGEKKYEIVDGQQRMQTIWDFRDNKFPLDGRISGDKLDGLRYRDLPEDLIDQFDTFQLTCVVLEGYDDEKTRQLFSKLQRGKPLNPGEKLNAFPGSVVPVMRQLGRHSFFNKVVFSLRRYKAYLIAAKLMLLESEGICDISPRNVYEFFMKNRNMKNTSRVPTKINSVLKYLDKAFPSKTPELSGEVWMINLYLLTSDLMNRYVIKGRERDLYNFYIEFWKKIEKARRSGKGQPGELRFADANTSGTTSKQNIKTRFEIMKKEFLYTHMDLELLDPKRFFDHFEKIVIYRRDKGICQGCGKEVPWKNYEADHIRAYITGGPTAIENGQVLCSICNAKKGAKSKAEL